jgi:hypothetical protein
MGETPLVLRPISLHDARLIVTQWHRHHEAPQGGKFALSVERGGVLCGVAIVGRPVSRALDDGVTAEVIRVATDGTRNACSFLYGAAKRAAQAMGYRKVITYTLIDENGASLRGAGWTRDGISAGGGWRCAARPAATDSYPLQQKIRWIA